MSCCQCQGLETLFDNKTAAKELKQYREKGPAKTTRMLIDALKAEGIEAMTLLDIGGGIGAIQHELLNAGAGKATNVDASTAYIKAAKEEAERQGHAGRVNYHYGNFVDLAPELEPAHIVTLDRAICCYHDMPTLVGRSSELVRNFYALVYPRDSWWVRIGMAVINFFLWLSRASYRFFIHSSEAVDAIVRDNGLKQRFYRKTFLWQVVVYARPNPESKI